MQIGQPFATGANAGNLWQSAWFYGNEPTKAYHRSSSLRAGLHDAPAGAARLGGLAAAGESMPRGSRDPLGIGAATGRWWTA